MPRGGSSTRAEGGERFPGRCGCPSRRRSPSTAAEPLAEDRKRDLPITFDMARGGSAAAAAVLGLAGLGHMARRRSLAAGPRGEALQGRCRDRPVPAVRRPDRPGEGPEAPARPRRRDRRLDRAADCPSTWTPRTRDSCSSTTTTSITPRSTARRRSGSPTIPARSSMPSSARTASPWPSSATTTSTSSTSRARRSGPSRRAGPTTCVTAIADWVYFEEIFNRRWPAFWWSPDSKQIAFMEFDDAAVGTLTMLDDTGSPRKVEQNQYPRVGRAEPEGPPRDRRRARAGRCAGPT